MGANASFYGNLLQSVKFEIPTFVQLIRFGSQALFDLVTAMIPYGPSGIGSDPFGNNSSQNFQELLIFDKWARRPIATR